MKSKGKGKGKDGNAKGRGKGRGKAARPSGRPDVQPSKFAPVMPYFSASLAARVGRAFAGLAPAKVCRRPEDVAFFRPESLPYWINDTVHRHLMLRMRKGWTGGQEEPPRTPPLQRWSVGVASTDLEGAVAVAVVLDAQSSVEPVAGIMAALPHLARSAEKAASGDEAEFETCWLCLAEYRPEGEYRPVDAFGCGHPVCEACRSSVMALTECGMCRARKSVFATLKEELVFEANEMRAVWEVMARKAKTMPEHDRDVAAEIDRLVTLL